MTVCLAAIYNNNSILGVSDRMLTAGDVEFEPTRPKIFPITNSIVALTAGHANIQTQILAKMNTFIGEKIAANPEHWIPVSDVAEFYGESYLKLRADLAEKAILVPQGLTYEKFIAGQGNMSDEFINKISIRLQNFSISGIETIITGIDETGPHIYVIRNGEVSYNDSIGFAAVGIGAYHALSHFMLSSHTRSTSEPKALLTVHQAKKKAEVSPGVGEQTDLFVIGPLPGSFNLLLPLPQLDIVKDLDEFYKKYVKDINHLDKNIEDKIKDYVAHLGERRMQKQEVNPTPSVSPSASTSQSVSASPSTSPSTKAKKNVKKK